MEQHLRWIVPLVTVPVVLVVGLLGFVGMAGSPTVQDSLGLSLLTLLVPVLALAAAAVGVVLTVRGVRRTYGDGRRARGRFTAVELAQRAGVDEGHRAWAAARELRRSLTRREVPAAIPVWDVVPEPGEVFFYDVTADYERYYGQDVTYSQRGGLYLGRPSFVLAGLAISGLANASARRSAEAQAAAQWRDHQRVRVLVSNTRLVCQVRGEWLTFSYSAMSAVYPEVSEWTLVCQFQGPAGPLRLRGNGVPLAAVMTVFATRGIDAVAAHPSLAALGGIEAGGTEASGSEAGGTAAGASDPQGPHDAPGPDGWRPPAVGTGSTP